MMMKPETRRFDRMFRAVRKLSSEEFEVLLETLKHYSCNTKFPSMFFLRADQLKTIPKDVMIALMSEDIHLVWDRLPEELRQDEDMKRYARCIEHHHPGFIHGGGFVRRGECVQCTKSVCERV